MLCIRPYKSRPGLEFGCGQCLPCRINRRRMWTARIVLEASCHDSVPFVTFTYAPENLPRAGSLVPRHVEELRYRLRYKIGPFRYYVVGEYGDRSGRAHYHGLFFGVPSDPDLLQSCWDHGHIHVGNCTIESAGYTAGYVTKKMTGKDDERLKGRHPEFARMSRKPGIGAPGLDNIRNWLYGPDGVKYIIAVGDVPKSIRFGGAIYPLGRYLVCCLREEFGLAEANIARSTVAEATRLALAMPEITALREYKREQQWRAAHAYADLRRSFQKL